MAFSRDLTTRFRADTRNFDRGTRRMRDSLRRLERTTDRRMGAIDRRMRRAGQAFIAAFAGLATIQGVRRLVQGVENAANQLDNIAKQADKLGLTTDALQELRVAAELSGVAVNTFDMAFQRFTRRAAEAANGTGEAKDALRQLGIELKDAEGNLRPTEVLFTEVADAIAAIENPAERVRLAFKLFDSEGVSLVNMLQRGSAALDDMRQKARDLGIVIDEDLIRRSVEAKDELSLLRRVIDAELTVALAELAPLLVDITGFLADVASAAATAYRGMRRLAGVQFDSIAVPGLTEDLAAARAELAEFDRDFAERMENFGENLSGDQLNAVLEREAVRRQAIVDRIEQLQRNLATALGSGEDVAPAPEPIIPPSGGGGAVTRRSGGSLSAEATEERETALQRELRVLAERTNEISRMTAAQARLDPEMEGYAVALRAAEIEARLIAKAEAEGVEVKDELARKIREIAQAYAEAEGAADRFNEKQKETEEDEALKNLADGLGTVISQAATFEDALEGVLRKLAEVALQAALLSALSGGSTPSGKGNALSGIFDSLFSGIFHKGGVVGQTATPMRQVPAATFLGAPRMHSGGIAGLRPNEVPAILEKGEIVVPKDIGMGRGGNNVTVEGSTIVLQGSDATPEELERVLDRRDRRLVEQIIRMNDDDPSILKT